MRYRRRLALGVVIAAACGFASCGDGEDSDTTSSTVAEDVAATCSDFCRQAGGFGDPGEIESMPVTIPQQEIDGAGDGAVSITATCNLDVDCDGAIILGGSHVPEYGRADLAIPAGATAEVPVEIAQEGVDALEANGGDSEAFVTVPLADTSQPVSFSDLVTVSAS